LDACAGTLASLSPGGAERAAARDEYIAARRTVLPALLDAARAGGVPVDAVAAVAEAHFGQGLTFFHFSAQPEGFHSSTYRRSLNRFVTDIMIDGSQRIPQKLLTLS
jgi:hypothetical protein